jgi:hypothetical protein
VTRATWMRRQWLDDLRAFWGYEVTDKGQTRLWLAVVWRLPRRLVYWCAVRVIAHATTGQYGHTVVPQLTAIDALKRWDHPHEPQPVHGSPGPPTVAG